MSTYNIFVHGARKVTMLTLTKAPNEKSPGMVQVIAKLKPNISVRAAPAEALVRSAFKPCPLPSTSTIAYLQNPAISIRPLSHLIL